MPALLDKRRSNRLREVDVEIVDAEDISLDELVVKSADHLIGKRRIPMQVVCTVLTTVTMALTRFAIGTSTATTRLTVTEPTTTSEFITETVTIL